MSAPRVSRAFVCGILNLLLSTSLAEPKRCATRTNTVAPFANVVRAAHRFGSASKVLNSRLRMPHTKARDIRGADIKNAHDPGHPLR